MRIRSLLCASTVATAIAALLLVGPLQPGTALGQAAIPPELTKLRPIKGVAYDPKPSDFPLDGAPPAAYFDSDFFNRDFTAMWGDAGDGSRKDLDIIKNTAGLNFIHLYNWNPQRDHTSFLDAAEARGLKLWIPISNFTAQVVVGDICGTCGKKGYQAAFKIIEGIFDQIYRGTTTPHAAAALWGIYNEYDINPIDPETVAFAIQSILTLEKQKGIPPANRLPITVVVSDAMFARDGRNGRTRAQLAALERATLQWLKMPGNDGRNVDSTAAADLPGAVLAILVVSNALKDAQTVTSYGPKLDDTGPQTVDAVPADFWKTRFIASSNPFRLGPTIRNYLLDKKEFQSAFPGIIPGTTTEDPWTTLPPLLFGEFGFSQQASGGSPTCPSAECLAQQAAVVLKQLQCTNPLAVSGGTPQGYFLGSTFFQASFVDKAHFEAVEFVSGQFATFTETDAPDPARGQQYRVDVVKALPVAQSVIDGYKADSATCD
jgi:hypothetical protein